MSFIGGFKLVCVAFFMVCAEF